jgi:hypothetical protein
MSVEIFKLIARIRRAMPRNTDVMDLCDWAEARAVETEPEKFDRRSYMRDYMRKRRAEGKP